MTSRTAGRLQLLAAAALFSTGGAAIKATDLGAWQVAGSALESRSWCCYA